MGAFKVLFHDIASGVNAVGWWPEERPLPLKDEELLIVRPEFGEESKIATVVAVTTFYTSGRLVESDIGKEALPFWAKIVQVFVSFRLLTPQEREARPNLYLVRTNG